MFDQLVEMLNQMADADPKEAAGFRAMIMFRDGLIKDSRISLDLANRLAMQAQIVIGSEYTDEELHLAVDPMVTMVSKMYDAFRAEGFEAEHFALLGRDLSLELP